MDGGLPTRPHPEGQPTRDREEGEETQTEEARDGMGGGGGGPPAGGGAVAGQRPFVRRLALRPPCSRHGCWEPSVPPTSQPLLGPPEPSGGCLAQPGSPVRVSVQDCGVRAGFLSLSASHFVT